VLLGFALTDSEGLKVILGADISSDDFYSPAHRLIFKHILDLSSAGDPVDLVTVNDSLHRTGDLDRAGGSA
jgi:replicative DNA helicase